MPVIKGTASVSDDRVRERLLRQTKFPSNFKLKVDVSKINRPVVIKWMHDKITELLNGVEDDIVQDMAVNSFLSGVVQPKQAQLDLAGFLGNAEAAQFARELWTLLLEAQNAPHGIPPSLVEQKKKQMHDPQMQTLVQEAQRRAQAARSLLLQQQQQRNQHQHQRIPHIPPQQLLPPLVQPDPRRVRDDRGAPDFRGVPPMVVPPDSNPEIPPSDDDTVDLEKQKQNIHNGDDDDDDTVELKISKSPTQERKARRRSSSSEDDEDDDDPRDRKHRSRHSRKHRSSSSKHKSSKRRRSRDDKKDHSHRSSRRHYRVDHY